MRVLHVVGNMNCGGVENFIINIMNNINEKIIFDFIYLDKKGDYYFDEIIREHRGKIYYLDKPNSINIIKFIKNFIKVIRKNDYKIVHTHVGYNSGLISMLAKFNGVKKIFTHAHTTKDNKNDISIKRKIYIKLSKKLISIFSTKKLACGIEAGEHLYGKRKFLVINNGIDFSKFTQLDFKKVSDIKKKYLINSCDFVIGHIGRLTEVKNHDFIINLAKSLIENNNKYKFLLLGDGELYKYLNNKIDKLGLTKNIILVGNVNEIPEYLECMDLVILPSLYEGFPVTLVETQISGLPFIASNFVPEEVNMHINKNKFLELDLIEWKNYIIKNKFYRVNKKEASVKMKLYNIKNVSQVMKKLYKED